jgi:hypothetical protein
MTEPNAIQPISPEDARDWAAAWQRAAKVLDADRAERARNTSVASAIAALDDAFESALVARVCDLSSGLVDQQRHFARLR